MKGSTQILIASADVGHCMALEGILTQEGWETICVSRLGEMPGGTGSREYRIRVL
jgi:hypothetical protein